MASTKVNQKIPIDTVQVTLDKLDKLESKPKDELTLRESITLLSDKLHSALKKGYSYQDLAEILETQKILISATTLKQYLSEIDKEKRGRKVRTKPSVAKQSPQSLSAESTLTNSDVPLSELSQSPLAIEPDDVTPLKSDSKPDGKPVSVTPVPETTSKTTRRTKTKVDKDIADDFNKY